MWEILTEMVRFKYQAGKDPGALVMDLAMAFEQVSLLVVGLGTHFSFPRKILRVLCGYFEHQRRVLNVELLVSS